MNSAPKSTQKAAAAVLPLITPRLKDLTRPFSERDIEWRVQRAGVSHGRPWALVLAYVDARAVQNRLDEVVGPENWTVRYHHIQGGVMCDLSIRCNDEWVTKSDGSPETNVEAFKGGISKALVRAASVWGIGRYLYRLTESFAVFVDKRTEGARDVTIEGQRYFWIPPELPSWALPEGEQPQRRQIVSNQAPESEVTTAPRDHSTNTVLSNPIDFRPENDDFVGGYVVNFGKKHFGKKLSDMSPDEIEGYRDWLLEDARKTGKPLSGKAADFLHAADLYLNNFRSEKEASAATAANESLPF